MILFIDASAIVAMVAREPEASSFAHFVGIADARHSSPIAVWEAVRAVARVRGVDDKEAYDLVDTFLRTSRIDIMPIGAAEGFGAVEAHRAYGKGRHAAALNMGDCFSYACTKALGASILFKGVDFTRTDLTDGTLA